MDDQHPTTSILGWLMNGVSTSTVIGALYGIVPSIAAFVALIWYVIQIHESHTVQKWLANRRNRRIARLKARILMLESSIAPLPADIEQKL